MSENNGSLPYRKREGVKVYYDCDLNAVRRVLDGQIGFTPVAKRNEENKWESYGYLALAKSGKAVRIMIVQQPAE